MASVKVVVVPAQTLLLPLIGAGDGTTVIARVTVHEAPKEYVIVVVPAAIPLTLPLEDPMLALAELLVHTPPATELVSVVVAPTQTVGIPPMTEGAGLTVIIFVTPQPVGNVYDIAVAPVTTPVTTPVPEPTVAIPADALLHVPVLLLVAVIVAPTHTADGPAMGDGNGFTVIGVVREQPVGAV